MKALQFCVILSALVVANGSKTFKTNPWHSWDWVAPEMRREPPSPEPLAKPNEHFLEQSSVHPSDKPTSKFPDPNERFREQSSVHPSDEATSKTPEPNAYFLVEKVRKGVVTEVRREPPSPKPLAEPNEHFLEQSFVHPSDKPTSKLPDPNERLREQSSVHPSDEATSKLRPEPHPEANKRFREQSSVHPSDEATSKKPEPNAHFLVEKLRKLEEENEQKTTEIRKLKRSLMKSQQDDGSHASSALPEVSASSAALPEPRTQARNERLREQSFVHPSDKPTSKFPDPNEHFREQSSVHPSDEATSKLRPEPPPEADKRFREQSSVHPSDEATSKLPAPNERLREQSSVQPSDGPTSKLVLGQPSLEPYRLSVQRRQSSYSQWKQDLILAPILNQIKKGFFVESGARNGEDHSNTLYYELRGWRGLLIEPGQEYYGIAGKHRKSHSFHGALALSGKSSRLNFLDEGWGLSHLIERERDSSSGKEVEAQPLEKLLAAIDPHRTTVDFWSLDVEGSEGAVLETTNFHKIKVGLLLVEMNKNFVNNGRISAVMHKHGFIDIGRTTEPLRYSDGSWNPFKGQQHTKYLDHVFVNPAYFRDLGLPVPGKVPGLY